MIFNEFQWITIIFNEIYRFPMILHGFQWFLLILKDFQCFSMIFIAFYSTSDSVILSDFQWSEERAWRGNACELRTLPPERYFSKQNHKPSTRTPVLNSEPRTHGPLDMPSHKARWRKLQNGVWPFGSCIFN